MPQSIGTWLLVFASLLVLTSLASIALFWWDKRAAGANRQRISERTLHLWALAGGWPGAFFARSRFRHKTQKQPFTAILWAAAIANVLAWAAIVWLVITLRKNTGG